MQVTSLNGAVLTGQANIGSVTGLAPMAGDGSAPMEIQVAPANPGGVDLAEANEAMPGHIDSGGPAALAAPAAPAMPGSMGSTGEPTSMYSVPMQKGGGS